jgi:DNA polymerase-3 subunit delta'
MAPEKSKAVKSKPEESKLDAGGERDAWGAALGHGDVLRGLARAAAVQRLPHALLFEGPEGVGKFLAARRLALGLLCARGDVADPCGVCGPCKRVIAGVHGDLLLVDVLDDPAKERREELTIGRVTRRDDSPDGPTIEEFLSLRATEGGWRVVIVREAERMNAEAQNALLKTLEEPPENALLVLESSRSAALLPTIRSRCVRIEFGRVSGESIASLLAEHGVAADRASTVARWSAGSPGRALALASNSGPELRKLLADLLRGAGTPFEVARAVWELDGEFEGKTARAVERERLRFVLDFWLGVLGDLHGAQAVHGDLFEPADRPLLLRSQSALRRAIETVFDLRADVDDNLDPPTLLDRACVALAPRPVRAHAATRP